MPMTLAEIEKEAFNLNNEEKFLLIQDIGASLAVSRVERDWYEEAARRRDELLSGRVKGIPLESIVKDIESRRSACK